MPFRRALRWTLPPLALLALVGWFASGKTPIAGSPADSAAPQSSGMVPVSGPAVQPPSAAGPDRLTAVQHFVDQKNAESGKDKEAFVKAGWHFDNVPPPDPKLLA